MPELRTQPTPNPNALKFSLADTRLLESGLLAFNSSAEAAAHPFASALFAVQGVANVFITPDFATITKHPAADWGQMMPSLREAFGDYAKNLASMS
ncbi:MAG: NifU N-terminal domain-containing protein [Bacteroidota bacterium]